MRAPVRLLAVTMITVAAASACSGGGKTDAVTNVAGGGNVAGAAANGGGGESMEGNAGADPDEGKIPHGTDLGKAKAAGLGSDGAPVISVVGTDTECTADTATVKAGKIWVKFTNSGNKINEVYLETSANEEIAEVENIPAGKSGGFSYTVKAGSFQLACEPGMNDHQVRVPLTVTN